MHTYNNTNPMSIDRLCQVELGIVESIDSISDDPIARSLEKRRPKKYPCVWINSLNRPVINFADDPSVGFLQLYTQSELVEDSMAHFCVANTWSRGDLEIQRFTFVEALALARDLPTPIALVRKRGVCERINGVGIEGVRSDNFYAI